MNAKSSRKAPKSPKSTSTQADEAMDQLNKSMGFPTAAEAAAAEALAKAGEVPETQGEATQGEATQGDGQATQENGKVRGAYYAAWKARREAQMSPVYRVDAFTRVRKVEKVHWDLVERIMVLDTLWVPEEYKGNPDLGTPAKVLVLTYGEHVQVTVVLATKDSGVLQAEVDSILQYGVVVRPAGPGVDELFWPPTSAPPVFRRLGLLKAEEKSPLAF